MSRLITWVAASGRVRASGACKPERAAAERSGAALDTHLRPDSAVL